MIIERTPESIAWQEPGDDAIYYFEYQQGHVSVYKLDGTRTRGNHDDWFNFNWLPPIPPDPLLCRRVTISKWFAICENPMRYLSVEVLS